MTEPSRNSRIQIDWHTGVPLAQGGSGEIVRAYSPQLDRDIAVKYLRHEEPAAIERMLREARTQADLNHPHILPIHATGVHLDRHYIAMDLVDGQALDCFLADRSTDHKLAIFDQVLDAMAYAHAQDVVHRDLKPANLMVELCDGQAHAWVMDFGLARRPDDATLTMAGDALGTPGYMSPEQARGAEGADPRADVYALGVVLYQVLTGTLPYTADTPMALVMQAASGQIVPVSEIRRRLPEGLARIVVCCLEADPSRRYRDAGELRRDLAAFRAGHTVDAPILGRRYRLSRWARANPWRARLAAALAAVMLGGGIALAVIAEQNRQALNTASTLIAEAERARGDWYIDQLLPLHDQRGAEQAARATVDRLAAARDRLGDVAAARIDAALADLLDAIGEPGRAFIQARRAWLGGVQTASVASRAARARLQQFGSRRLELGLTADAASMDRLVEVEREALAADISPFRSALDDDMLQRIERALGTAPGVPVPDLSNTSSALITPDDWQTLLLDLQVAAVSAIDDLNIDADRSLADLARVDDRLEDLRQTARSYLPAYQLACSIEAARQSLRTMQADAAAPDVSRASCDQGLQLAAEDPDLLATSSTQLWLQAKHFRRDRLPFDQPLDRAISQARLALEIDPGNELAQLSLGSALQVLGRKQLAAGEASRPTLEASLEWLERVHQARPNDVNVMNNLAVTWSTISMSRAGAGDSRGALEAERQGLEWLQRATAVTPDDRRLMHNMWSAKGSITFQDALLGRDPEPDLEVLIEGLTTLTDRHSDYVSPLNTLGLNWWTLGLWHALNGRDPAPAMRAAQATFERALAARPDWESPRINHAGVARQWYALSESEPNAALSTRANAALATYRELEGEGGELSEFGCQIAEILVAQARWASPERATNLLREAEAMSRLDRNIEWSHDGCRIARARSGLIRTGREAEPEAIGPLWEETLAAVEGSKDPLLLIAAARFARASGHEQWFEQWRERIPAPFRDRLTEQRDTRSAP